MADGNYARLREGRLSLAALVFPAKRGRGRPRGTVDTKPRKASVFQSCVPAMCAADGCEAVFGKKLPHERYCSAKCRNRAHNRSVNEMRRNSAPRPCRWCGVECEPEYGSLRTHYCTTECRDKASNARRAGNTHRRRAKKHGCEVAHVNKTKVFERDGWMCALCGCDTPKEVRGSGLQNSPELDHVVPLSRGGAHTYENTQCMRRACNGWKGAMTMDEARSALPGRPGAAAVAGDGGGGGSKFSPIDQGTDRFPFLS